MLVIKQENILLRFFIIVLKYVKNGKIDQQNNILRFRLWDYNFLLYEITFVLDNTVIIYLAVKKFTKIK